MSLSHLQILAESKHETNRMPVLFVGHGSPMNAIEQNEFSLGWQSISKNIPKPRAILCISAHWETKGTQVTAMEHPSTIHDFGGFPQALFDTQYLAPGSPLLAKETKDLITVAQVGMDENWGLDHGCWSVLKHMYPKADVPVVQFSLDYSLSPAGHFALAEELVTLRKKGVLILGSGNIVHNLGLLNWQHPDKAFDWALDARASLKTYILTNDIKSLVDYKTQGKSFDLAIPTPEHFLPLLYTLALKDKDEALSFFNDKLVMGSIAMTSLMIGNA